MALHNIIRGELKRLQGTFPYDFLRGAKQTGTNLYCVGEIARNIMQGNVYATPQDETPLQLSGQEKRAMYSLLGLTGRLEDIEGSIAEYTAPRGFSQPYDESTKQANIFTLQSVTAARIARRYSQRQRDRTRQS